MAKECHFPKKYVFQTLETFPLVEVICFFVISEFFWGFILQAGNSWLFLANGSVGACFSRFENSQILENLFFFRSDKFVIVFFEEEKIDFYIPGAAKL